MLDQGVLVPRLRKVGARWDIPIAALGAAMDARVPPASRDITPSTGRRSLKSTIGPRMLFRQEKAREVYALILNEVKRLQAEVARIDLEAKTPSAQRTTRRAEPSGRI